MTPTLTDRKLDTFAYIRELLQEAKVRRLKNTEIKFLKDKITENQCALDTANLLAELSINYQKQKQEQKERNKDFNNV